MKAKLLKLLPNSRFHFGKSKVISRVKNGPEGESYADDSASLTDTDTFLRSDVLFSALVNNLAQIRTASEVDAFVQGFKDGNIKISSGFYCIEKQQRNSQENLKSSEYIYLLPKPVTAPNHISINNYDDIKQIKRMQFVCPETIIEEPCKWSLLGSIGVSPKNRLAIDPDQKFSYKVLGKKEEDRKENFNLFYKKVATHVGIHRPNENAYGPYSVSYIQIPDYQKFNMGIHFYFLYEVSEQYQEDFDLAVELLKYNGVGGERSSGYGQVADIEDTVVNLQTSERELAGFPQITLSMVIPQKNEVENLHYYQYSLRGGRMSAYGRLLSVPMIHEGAILKKEINGKVACITPDGIQTKYKRNGKCFSIPVHPIFAKNEHENQPANT